MVIAWSRLVPPVRERLEWVARQKGKVEADHGDARLFIRPGDRFRVIDALITNFHLPASTPLILVVAFAGLELVRRVYAEAIEKISVLQLRRCNADSLHFGLYIRQF